MSDVVVNASLRRVIVKADSLCTDSLRIRHEIETTVRPSLNGEAHFSTIHRSRVRNDMWGVQLDRPEDQVGHLKPR
jgi:hypothetical protein